MDHFFVTEAAKRIGVHPSTLRDLENRGVIQVQRDWNGWRVYSEAQIKAIEKILYPRSGDTENGKASKP